MNEVRYIIIIANDEEPGYVTKEIQENITTALITARTWEEAEQLRQIMEVEHE